MSGLTLRTDAGWSTLGYRLMKFRHTEPFKVACIAAFVLITVASWFW